MMVIRVALAGVAILIPGLFIAANILSAEQSQDKIWTKARTLTLVGVFLTALLGVAAWLFGFVHSS